MNYKKGSFNPVKIIQWLPLFLLFLLNTGWGKELHILLKMLPEQRNFFRKNILAPFSKRQNVKIVIHDYSDNWNLIHVLKNNSFPCDIIKVPLSEAGKLVSGQWVAPIGDIVPKPTMAQIQKEYFLLNLATVKKTLYFIPRKFDTRITVYIKPQVERAVKIWKTFDAQINGSLAKAGLAALPNGYKLEADVNQWDYLDLYVAGFVWANTLHKGEKRGRIAHRGKAYSGTSIGLMDRCIQLGLPYKQLISANNPGFTEVLRWESLFAANKIYPKKMWEDKWTGESIWKAMGNGEVFLSFMTQIDCYKIHGSGTDGFEGYLNSPVEMGVAVLPAARTLTEGKIISRSASTGGWLWGIHHLSQNKTLSFQLIRHITNFKNQIAECEHFGIIPVRKDILKNKRILFSQSWKNLVFHTSIRQLRQNGKNRIPYSDNFQFLEQTYSKLWRKIVEPSYSEGYHNLESIKAITAEKEVQPLGINNVTNE